MTILLGLFARTLAFLALLCTATSVFAQAGSARIQTKATAEAGLESPWDVRNILNRLTQDNQQIKPLLDQMHPQEWYDKKGAPSAYVQQLQTGQRQLNDVLVTAKLFSAKTGDLSLALDTYFRLEAFEVTARSLNEGARKYGDRTTADKLSVLIARNFNDRERLRDYLRDLATSIQQNFKIADEEAQRCRGIISKEPPVTQRRSRH